MPRGGARPGAGRKTAKDEEKITFLLNLCVDETIKYIQNESVSLKDRSEVFSRIVSKAIPQNLTLAGGLTHNVFMQNIIAKSKGVLNGCSS